MTAVDRNEFRQMLISRSLYALESPSEDAADFVVRYIDRVLDEAALPGGKVNVEKVDMLMQGLNRAAHAASAAPRTDYPDPEQIPTFGDWLALVGYPMNPDTVIMDATAVNREMYRRERAGEPDVTVETVQNALALPPYDNMLLEWRDCSGEHAGLPLVFYGGIVAYWQAARLERVDTHSWNLWALSLTPGTPADPGTLLHSHTPMRVHFEDGCYVAHLPTAIEPPDLHPATLTNAHGHDYVVFAIWALSMLHQRSEIELVTQTRGPRRRFEKKHGKQPSPYFRFRDIRPGSTHKSYAGDNPTPTGRTMPVHTVRGHFRHYTDGKVVWIRPHVRGSGSSVQDRPYRIVLKSQGGK